MLDTKISAVTEFAIQLMSRKSLTPYDDGCQKLIIDRLKPLDFKCHSLRFGEVDNLWARYGTEGPLFVFAGHTDVVPSGPEEDWTSPPFNPQIREGFLYGRGAVDMKGAVAAMVIAAEQFIKTHPNFPGSIAFLITSDEEGHAVDGTAKVMEWLKEHKEKIDYCIVGEPSADSHVGDQIRVGRRGSLHGVLTIHGKQGHVANPHLAINPIHQGAMALHEIANTEWDKGNDSYPPTTFQITNIHGGTGANNVIPGHLRIVFNFRFGTAVTVDQLKQRLHESLKKHKLRADVDWKIAADPFLTPRGKLVNIAQTVLRELTHQETRLSTGGGTSDGRFIAPSGAELIELGVSNATAHHVDECVRIKDLDLLTETYKQILGLIFK